MGHRRSRPATNPSCEGPGWAGFGGTARFGRVSGPLGSSGAVPIVLIWQVQGAVPLSACSAVRRSKTAAKSSQANRQNVIERIEFVEGNFVRRATGIDTADIVTLDRVVCCHGDAAALVGLSADRARGLYGLVLPRDGWLIRLSIRLANDLARRSLRFPGKLRDAPKLNVVSRTLVARAPWWP